MAHLLELTTTKKKTIKINGKVYPVKSGDAISLEASVRVTRLQKRLGDLKSESDLADVPDDELSLLGETCRDLCDEVLEAPDEVKESLTDNQKLEIIKAVFIQPAREKPAKKKGSKSSRRSKGSTAAQQKTG